MVVNSFDKYFVGLSTDSKPIFQQHGQIFVELDTGKLFIYNAYTRTWDDLFSFKTISFPQMFMRKGIAENRRLIAGAFTGTAMTTGTPAVNLQYAIPLVVPEKMTFDIATVNVTAAGTAGAVARIGMYRDGGSVYPTDLMWESANIDITTTGAKDISIPSDHQTLKPGLYWVTYNTGTAAATMRCVVVANTLPFLLTDNALGTAISGLYTRTTSFGAMPNPFPAGATYASATFPAIGFRPI